MSDVNGIGGNQPVNRVGPAKIAPRTPIDQPAISARADRVELSDLSALMSKLKTNDVRADKIAEIKAQIEAGKYETSDKIDGAIEKLIDELNS
jgi:negative regulator of flagellin synthesis FlgM